MKAPKNTVRRRQVAWTDCVDDTAITLAIERGYYPERVNGGVSKFLADLVQKEADKTIRLPNAPVATSSLKQKKTSCG